MSTRKTSTSESSTRTKAAEELATTTDADVVGRPVNAELSSPIKPGKRQGSPISASLPSFVARNITFRLLVRMSQYLNCNELPSDCCHDAIIPKKIDRMRSVQMVRRFVEIKILPTSRISGSLNDKS